MATVSTGMTTEGMLALPEDGRERWLVAGELRGRAEGPRDRFGCLATTRAARYLDDWLDRQPEPRGQILALTGIRLRRNPDTTLNADVAYIPAEVLSLQADAFPLIDGIPTLAVEILSPGDTIGGVNEKIDLYLAAGVPVVWIIDPRRRTVTVHAPGAEPVLFNARQELADNPHLPGFRVAVARLFE